MNKNCKDVELREAFLELCTLVHETALDIYEENEIKRIGKIAEKLFAETQDGGSHADKIQAYHDAMARGEGG